MSAVADTKQVPGTASEELEFAALKEQMQAKSKPIAGPTAFTGEFKRTIHLTWVVAVTDFKLKFFGSVLGYLWQLMRPLMMFGILFVVFTQFMNLGNKVAFYPAILLSGIVMFTFFSESTAGAVAAVVMRENLVRKIRFPRIVVPLASVVTAFLNLMLNFVAVLIFMAAIGVKPTLGWIAFPFLMLALAAFAAGIAALLSALFVRYRDVQPIWDVFLQAFFYASPILYPVEAVNAAGLLPPGQMQKIILCNPFATILQQFRHWIIDPAAPDAASIMGGAQYLLIPITIAVGVIVLGFWVFNREAKRIAEEL